MDGKVTAAWQKVVTALSRSGDLEKSVTSEGMTIRTVEVEQR